MATALMYVGPRVDPVAAVVQALLWSLLLAVGLVVAVAGRGAGGVGCGGGGGGEAADRGWGDRGVCGGLSAQAGEAPCVIIW